MKVRPVAAAVVAGGLLATLGTIIPADAGGFTPLFPVVVDKVVDGPVPEGTVFEVEVTCTPEQGDPATTTLEFDANGDPLGDDTVLGEPLGSCSVTETVTGGATVGYACTTGVPPEDPVAEQVEVAPTLCVDDQTVQFGEVAVGQTTFTVTNTFEPEPEPESEAAPADVVAARPSFTG